MEKPTNNKSKNPTMKEMSNRVLMLQEERDIQPAHILLNVNSYSLLPTDQEGKHETKFFDFDGYPYKWKLIFYPHGDNTCEGKGHISLYLAIDEDTLGRDETFLTVCVDLKFFVLNKNTKKYLTVQDATGALVYFGKARSVQGFSQLLSLEKFKDPSNGYLVDDACAFGAEFFIVQPSRRTRHEALTLYKDPNVKVVENADQVFKESDGKTFTWEIKNFLSKGHEVLRFEAIERTWWLHLFPKGKDTTNGSFMAIYFSVNDPSRKIYVKVITRVVNHPGTKSKKKEGTFSGWFDENWREWVKPDITMPLSELHEFLNGEGTLLLQVKFEVISQII